MDKVSWILFWVSVALMLIGMIDRMLPEPLVEGFASGTYWKGAVGFVLYSIALGVLRPERARP